ncbi:hypothetical protein CLOM_g18421 [Closterium sp. NIES-68]|nr:hypothetical protein CLOM_g18421 [Closterium sp. NIES-68]
MGDDQSASQSPAPSARGGTAAAHARASSPYSPSPALVAPAFSQEHLPWIMKSAHEKPYEEELKRRILALSQRPEEFLYGELDPSLLIDMRQATLMAASVLQVDEELRQLRLRFVPRVMKEQEFWRRYFVAVKALKHHVLTQPQPQPQLQPQQEQQEEGERELQGRQQQHKHQQRGVNGSAPSSKSLISSFGSMANAGAAAATATATATSTGSDMSQGPSTLRSLGSSGSRSSHAGRGGSGGGDGSGGGGGSGGGDGSDGGERLVPPGASLSSSGGISAAPHSAPNARDDAAAGAAAGAGEGGGGGGGGGEGGGGAAGLSRSGSGRRSMSFSGTQPWTSPPLGRPLSPGKQRPPLGKGRSDDKERAMRRSLAREESVDEDVDDFLQPISVPSSVTIRRLAQALNMARAFATVEDMACEGSIDDSPDAPSRARGAMGGAAAGMGGAGSGSGMGGTAGRGEDGFSGGGGVGGGLSGSAGAGGAGASGSDRWSSLVMQTMEAGFAAALSLAPKGMPGPGGHSGAHGGMAGSEGHSRTRTLAFGPGEYSALLWSLFDLEDESWESPEGLEPLHLGHSSSTSGSGSLASPAQNHKQAGAAGRSEPSIVHEIHGAPPSGFVAQLAETMAGISSDCKMAGFWMQIVLELRRRWVARRFIPRVPQDSDPDLHTCLLHQHLHLLNCCTARRLRRSHQLAHGSPSTAGTGGGAGGTWGAGNGGGASKGGEGGGGGVGGGKGGEDRRKGGGGFAGSGGKDEEGGECGSRAVGGVAEKAGAGAGVGEGGGGAGVGMSGGMRRRGVLRRVPGLDLLDTGEPLCAPITQEGPVLTEVTLREQEELIMRTGR